MLRLDIRYLQFRNAQICSRDQNIVIAEHTLNANRAGSFRFEFLQCRYYGVLLMACRQCSEKRLKRVNGYRVCMHEQRSGAPDTDFLEPNQGWLFRVNLISDSGGAFRNVARLDLQVSSSYLNGKTLWRCRLKYRCKIRGFVQVSSHDRENPVSVVFGNGSRIGSAQCD